MSDIENKCSFTVLSDTSYSGSYGYLDPTYYKTNNRGMHSHSSWEVILIIEGSGFANIEGTRHAFSPGSILNIPPETNHLLLPDRLQLELCMGLSVNLSPSKTFAIYHDDERGSFRSLAESYDAFFQHQLCGYELMLPALLRAMQAFLCSRQPARLNPDVFELANLLESNYTDPSFRAADAVNQIPLSDDYVRRQFRAVFHMSPITYLTQLRITEAKNLLVGTDLSITELCLRSGFSDSKYFARVFRQLTDSTPMEYRNQFKLSSTE